MENGYSLMVHGGAGKVMQPEECQEGMREALIAGKEILETGGSAVDAVARAVAVLEDNPLFNAGKGSVLDEHGCVEMDASIMDGLGLRAGAVAGVQSVRNPIMLARAIMDRSPHVFLIGEGALEFARREHLALEPDDYFITESRRKQLADAKEQDTMTLDHAEADPDKKYGTVGAVARDRAGNLAAATSTGGIVNKHFGRVGDTPIIGSGTYADNGTLAVSATGYGEQFIRTVLAKTVADIARYTGADAQKAAEEGIAYLVESVQGLGGIIVIDRAGNLGSAFSTSGLARGYLLPDGSMETKIGA